MQAAGSEATVHIHMLQACETDHLARMLCRLGSELDVRVWQDCWPRARPAPQPATDEPVDVASLQHSASIDASSSLESNASPQDSQDPSTDPAPGSRHTSSSVSDGAAGSDSISTHHVSCKKFIEQLRRTRFGVGLELTEQAKEYTLAANEMLGQAAQALSVDTNSRDVHFVQELLQNADDTAYAPGLLPTVEFVLDHDCITVFINEVSVLVMMPTCLSPY